MTKTLEKDPIALKKLRFVEVKWRDAAVEDSWTSIHDEDIVAAPCISRGWVMRQDETQILLCGTVGFNGEGLVEEANTIISIPSPMVLSISDFPPRRKRKPASKPQQNVTLEDINAPRRHP